MYLLGDIVRKHITEGRLTSRFGRLSGPLLSDPKDGLFKTMLLTEAEGRRPWAHKETLQKKLDVARQISIPHLFESLIGSIHSVCRDQHLFEAQVTNLFKSAQAKMLVGSQMEEAEVFANAFRLLTQAKLFTTMTAVYTLAATVSERLFGSFDSPFEKFDHQIPSEAPELDYVVMGGNYPTKKIVDRFAQTKAWKFGGIIELARETMISDLTGLVVQTAEGLALSAKYREDELAALAWQDVSNSTLVTEEEDADAGSYHPEQVQKALYRTAAVTIGTQQTYQTAINKTAANPLRQWDNIQIAYLLLDSMQNIAGQDIDVSVAGPIKIVVPQALAFRARMAINPFATHDTNANESAGTESLMMRVPDAVRVGLGIDQIEVIVWKKLPQAATADNSIWYLAGDSMKQFRRHVRWPVEFSRATPAQQGSDEFKRDVVMSVRAGFNSGPRSVDDKYVIQNPGS